MTTISNNKFTTTLDSSKYYTDDDIKIIKENYDDIISDYENEIEDFARVDISDYLGRTSSIDVDRL